jgi:hypothetical protein
MCSYILIDDYRIERAGLKNPMKLGFGRGNDGDSHDKSGVN